MAHKDTVDRGQVAAIAAQIGSSLDVDNDQWMNRFMVPSTSKPDVFYRVAQRKSDGSWGCDCWAWKRRRKCKHLTDILARLAAVAEATKGELDAAVLAMLASARTAYLDLDAGRAVKRPAMPARQLDL
jgi:hypothetical protein